HGDAGPLEPPRLLVLDDRRGGWLFGQRSFSLLLCALQGGQDGLATGGLRVEDDQDVPGEWIRFGTLDPEELAKPLPQLPRPASRPCRQVNAETAWKGRE